MAVITNASPLILYARIGRLDVLHTLFDKLLAPDAVLREVVTGGSGRPGAAEVEAAEWIERVAATAIDASIDAASLAALGSGEAAAIALAKVRDLAILLDDRAGRAAARGLGLRVIGSAGVAVLAKESGYLRAARPTIDALRGAGLHLHRRVYERLLEQAGEAV